MVTRQGKKVNPCKEAKRTLTFFFFFLRVCRGKPACTSQAREALRTAVFRVRGNVSRTWDFPCMFVLLARAQGPGHQLRTGTIQPGVEPFPPQTANWRKSYSFLGSHGRDWFLLRLLLLSGLGFPGTIYLGRLVLCHFFPRAHRQKQRLILQAVTSHSLTGVALRCLIDVY